MARLGINAKLKIATSETGLASASDVGIKDITTEVSATEVAISSRGYEWKRYLVGQKDMPVDTTAEADAPCVSIIQEAFWGGTDVWAQFEDAGGDKIVGAFVVSKCGMQSPVEGEEVFAFSLRPSARSGVEEPEYTAASSGSGGNSNSGDA